MLIVAATPIGNLGDASPRLVSALAEVSHIAAEDTRNLRKLAGLLGVKIHAKLYSLHEHNESDRLEQILDLVESTDVLLVSDAGMPTVSDPGFQLVRGAVERGLEVTVIPGPSAVLAALAISGLPTDRFTFEGFLPRKDGERRQLFESLRAETRTMVFFESAHRIQDSLDVAAAVLGADRPASVSRELTKKFEHTERGTLAELIEWSKSDPKGEMVLVIGGAPANNRDASELVDDVLALVASGQRMKDAVAEVAEIHGVSKSVLYQLAVDAKQ
ncbi:MAG: hypothetical protein RLZZ400_280 [Actinomycetota bacterium]